MNKPIIGITIGDPSGIGPEVSIKAILDNEIFENCRFILIGDKKVIEDTINLLDVKIPTNQINNIVEYKEDKINYISLDIISEEYNYGEVQLKCGKAAYHYIEKAINLALRNEIDAVVTGPINKEALNLAGYNYSGHTEIFSKLTNTDNYAMLLIGGNLKVIHVTTHISMREACNKIKKERIIGVIKLANEALLSFGVDNPRIAVSGFNAHSGENGLFGDEELKEIIPAIEETKKIGLNVNGPISPDTVFVHANNGLYDVVIAMYHDQGHIPLKLVDFGGGVNITVGLPIIRTSVDHGTAFGKAGKGTADERSMINAIKYALKFINNRHK